MMEKETVDDSWRIERAPFDVYVKSPSMRAGSLLNGELGSSTASLCRLGVCQQSSHPERSRHLFRIQDAADGGKRNVERSETVTHSSQYAFFASVSKGQVQENLSKGYQFFSTMEKLQGLVLAIASQHAYFSLCLLLLRRTKHGKSLC
jgi:hypothetical protein